MPPFAPPYAPPHASPFVPPFAPPYVPPRAFHNTAPHPDLFAFPHAPPPASPTFSEEPDSGIDVISEDEGDEDGHPEIIWSFTIDEVLKLCQTDNSQGED